MTILAQRVLGSGEPVYKPDLPTPRNSCAINSYFFINPPHRDQGPTPTSSGDVININVTDFQAILRLFIYKALYIINRIRGLKQL